jgi:hypothetical protein
MIDPQVSDAVVPQPQERGETANVVYLPQLAPSA